MPSTKADKFSWWLGFALFVMAFALSGSSIQVPIILAGDVVGPSSATVVKKISGILSSIDGIATVGIGVPVVGWNSVVTNQSTSQSTVTLAASPGAGDYFIHYYADLNTPCSTGSNSVSFNFGWTDASNARNAATGALTLGSSQSTSAFVSGIMPIHVGSGNLTYSSTVSGTCGSGTSSYDINAWVERIN
jgi:hypothetical protein